MILDKILIQRKIQLQREKESLSLGQLLKDAEDRKPPSFLEAIASYKELSIIAEIKKASPSKGVIKEDFDPIEIAKAYQEAEIQAISILTEEYYFQGSTTYLKQAKEYTDKPILRKDFIFDPYQIYEAKAIGASCVLLIVAMLQPKELKELMKLTEEIGLDALVEVHDEEEVKIAVDAGAKIIGINNRNLKTFSIDIHNTEKVMKYIPKETILIGESGIHTAEDFAYLKSLGVHGALIGESLMRAESISDKVNELRGISHV